MTSSFPNLDMAPNDENYRTSQHFSGTNYENYNGDNGEIYSGNSGNNSESETKGKNEQFLSSTVVSQKKKEFERFVRSVFKDSKDMNRYFESVKSLLGSKLEQVFSPETMIEYFDRISQKPFCRIANTDKSRWTDEEVLLLTHIVIYYTYSHQSEFETLSEEAWAFIASIFPNKDANQLKKRWQGCLKKTLWQVPWTQQEDDLLVQIINDKGHTRKWKEIAEELNARSDLEVYRHGRQCRERWNNHLDPSIARGPFTEEEDIKLFQIYKEVGKKWAEISKKMKNRTENAVKNRFNSLIKKLKNRQNTTLSENTSIMSIESEGETGSKLERKLVDAFLQQYDAAGTSGTKLDKSRGSLLKNELQDHSESIFESESEDDSYNHKNTGYLDKAYSKKKDTDGGKGHGYGDLNDPLRKMSNYHMEEEYSGRLKGSKYDPFSNLSIAHPPYQSSINQQFPHSAAIKRRQSAMSTENPLQNYSKIHSNPYQSKTPNLQHAFSATQGGMYPEMGFKTTSNPLLPYSHEHGAQDNPMLANIKNLTDLFEYDNSNADSPLKQNRFPFENYDVKGSQLQQTKLEEEANEMSPSKRIIGINHQFKAKRLDKYRTQHQIGRSNLQYAIVDLTKNEIYMVHPVTKENFNGVISKMNGEESMMASPFESAATNLKNPEFLMLGKSGEHSPSIGYLQSLMGKSNLMGETNSNVNTGNQSTDSKLGSMTQAERHFQDIRKIFAAPNNFDNNFKNNKGNNTTSQTS